MAKELGFALINPYTIRKSRTGGVIARLISRTGLELVGARMFGPSPALVEQYAALVRRSPALEPDEREIVADYVLRWYAPDPSGRRHRVLLLLFEGEDAIAKNRALMGATDPKKAEPGTIRADFAESIDANAVHGSDAPETAAIEIAYFFPASEVYAGR